MARSGDYCQSCKPRWQNAKKVPVRLVSLAAVSPNHKPVIVCPWCDGESIIKIAQAAAKRNRRATDKG